MMRIAQINTTYGSADSTGRNVKELHEFFKETGCESRVYVTRINNKEEEKTSDIILFSNKLDEKSHAILSRVTGFQGYFSHITTKALIRELKQYCPSVILLNVLHSNCINFELLFRYIAENQIPVIFVLHDCFFFTGHCCHYIDVKCEKWKKECGGCPSMRKWNKSLFFDTSRRALADKKRWYDAIKIKGVIAVSHWLEDEARQSILKDARITTVYNWVDQTIFKPTVEFPIEWKNFKGKQIALAVASVWGDDKGLQEIKRVALECPELIIVMIGANINGVETMENIYTVGIVNNNTKLAEYYSAASVFLNPSRQETFGKTTAEALACGTPVVAYRTTACTELIDDTRGALAELGDAAGYIREVKKVLKNGKGYYRGAALDFAHRKFDSKTKMLQYMDAIHSLIEEN